MTQPPIDEGVQPVDEGHFIPLRRSARELDQVHNELAIQSPEIGDVDHDLDFAVSHVRGYQEDVFEQKPGVGPGTGLEPQEADLAPLALDLACWGVADPTDLRWPDPPPPAQFEQARELLAELGAIDREGRITAHGKEMGRLPMHPRLAHMLVAGEAAGHGGALRAARPSSACTAAAHRCP